MTKLSTPIPTDWPCKRGYWTTGQRGTSRWITTGPMTTSQPTFIQSHQLSRSETSIGLLIVPRSSQCWMTGHRPVLHLKREAFNLCRTGAFMPMMQKEWVNLWMNKTNLAMEWESNHPTTSNSFIQTSIPIQWEWFSNQLMTRSKCFTVLMFSKYLTRCVSLIWRQHFEQPIC